MLFKGAPDLMDEFKDFLPDAIPPAQPTGMIGILPQPVTGPGVPGSLPPTESSSADKGAKASNRRRKRPEKEPVAPQKQVGGRVRRRNHRDLERL